MDLDELKNYLRIDSDNTEDDELIKSMALAAKEYIENSSGKRYDKKKKIWDTAIQIVVAHWFENRKIYMSKPGTVYELPHSASALIAHISLSSAYAPKR